MAIERLQHSLSKACEDCSFVPPPLVNQLRLSLPVAETSQAKSLNRPSASCFILLKKELHADAIHFSRCLSSPLGLRFLLTVIPGCGRWLSTLSPPPLPFFVSSPSHRHHHHRSPTTGWAVLYNGWLWAGPCLRMPEAVRMEVSS